MKRLFVLFLLIFILFPCICKENRYINNEIGFSLLIPKNLTIRKYMKNIEEENKNIIESDGKYKIEIVINLIKDIENGMTKEEIIKKLNNRENILANFMYKEYDNGSINFFKYKKETLGQIIFNIGYPGISRIPYKGLSFIKGEYLIIIYVQYYDPFDKIAKRYSNFFEYIEGEGYYWKEPISNNCKQFYSLIKTKSPNAPKELIKLEEYFNEIINSLELFDPKSIIYTPTVSNLRFRETPDLNGKFIRSLSQGEKLELLEKGKEETINNVKGTWLKVKTETGEVGWCFDAYLEEVKKK